MYLGVGTYLRQVSSFSATQYKPHEIRLTKSHALQVILKLSRSDTQISHLFQVCQCLHQTTLLLCASHKERCAKLELSTMKGAAIQNKFCNII